MICKSFENPFITHKILYDDIMEDILDTRHAEPPEPILPRNYSSKFNILDWSEVEIARQLTYISFNLLQNIKTDELLLEKWTKSEKDIKSPNVMKLIYRFNNVSYWVCEEILSYEKALHRAQAINKFLKVALECKKLNNFNDCTNIITGLNSFLIKNLSKTWLRIDIDHLNIFSELNTFCSPNKNYIRLKQATEAIKSDPCIPYLGLMLKNLAFIEEGPKYLKDDLINVLKIKKVGMILDEFKNQLQHNKYYIKPVFSLFILAEPKPKSEDELSKLADALGILLLFNFLRAF